MSAAIKSGLYTALWTFLGLFSVSLLSWLQDFTEWASKSGHAPLPGLSTLGYAAVAAFGGAASGFVAFVVRALQSEGLLPGQPPEFPAKP